MGNKNSRSASSRLSIRLDPPTSSSRGMYMAGSTISGAVFAQTTDSITNVELDLVFQGIEDVKVRYETTEGSGDDRKTVTKYSYSKHEFVRMTIPLVGGSSSVTNTGQYACPFQLKLPDDLPTSFSVEADGGYARVVYKVNAKVRNAGKKRKLWIGKSEKGGVQVKILAKPPSSTQPIPYSVQPTKTKVNFFGCVPRGHITFGAHVDDTRFSEGQDVEVKFGCKNESKATIDFAEASINESINWYSGNHRSGNYSTLSRQCFALDEDMGKRSKDEMKHIKEMKKGIGGAGNMAKSRGPSDTIYREIMSAVNEGTNKVNLRIPSRAHHTYDGKYIKVRHALRVHIKTPCCSSNPQANFNLQIVTLQSNITNISSEHSASPIPSAPPLPDGWEASTVVVAVPVVESATIVYGGGEVLKGEEDIVVSPSGTDGIGGVVPTIMSKPSLDALRSELKKTLSVRTTLEEKLTHSDWKNVIAGLQPGDVVSVVKAARMEFDQIDVAVLLAPNVHNFTCTYVVALLRAVCNWLRIQMVQKLLSYCVDANKNSKLILQELTSWEKISTEKDFENISA